MKAEKITAELKRYAVPGKKELLLRFFKCGEGEYGAGDLFLGVMVPDQRKIAQKFGDIDFGEIQKLLRSSYHEVRLTALLILVKKYAVVKNKEKIYKFYLANTHYINNWDLVDLSAPKIVGEYLLDKKNERKILYKLSRSKNIWERRIAILAAGAFIRKNQFEDTFKISGMLLKDKHDLIHKATGWMLREVGKRDRKAEESFLNKHHRQMPRTMLRYAIEKFPEKKRKYYLNKR
jgi:3-methyladenine DNA glycosylase AlkD